MSNVKSQRLEVRPLGADDYTAVVEVYRQTPRFIVELNGRPAESIGLEMVEEDAAQAANHGAPLAGIFLRESGQMIGVADYVPGSYRQRPSQAWLALLLIAGPYQRNGYGTEVYRLIEDEIFANPDVDTIGLGVLVNNGPAIAFWQRMGYRRAGSTAPDRDGREILILHKQRPEQDVNHGNG
jgi:RimJ/RimL family protein N-acetyltransferase